MPASQGVDVTAIDDDSEMIDAAGRFGFKLYYGDGGRLDVLRAAGAERVKMIAVCVSNIERVNRIVDLINEQFPDTKLYVRSYDRGHTLDLIKKGVNFELRETFSPRWRSAGPRSKGLASMPSARRRWKRRCAGVISSALRSSRPAASWPASTSC